jgi:epoxide hydrolase-like predicted phosphatase
VTVIKVIIFDLGQVVIKFNFRDALEQLQMISSVPREKVMMFFRSDAERLFTEGKINSRTFFERCKRELGIPIDFKNFRSIYNDIFEKNPPIAELIRSLKKCHRVMALSNTNELHMAYIMKRYSVMHLFDDIVTSFEEKCQKPDSKIFHITLERGRVQPHEAIFIDDTEGNVIAARSLGIHAVHYTDAELLAGQLKELGVAV